MISHTEIEAVLADHPSTEISADTVYELLSDRRRRYLLECLAEHGYSLTLADLADEVAAREHDCHIADVPEEVVLRIYLTLYHQHVPKLDAEDVVEYNQDGDLVARGELASVVDRVLDSEATD